MGCDIHLWVETQYDREPNKWTAFGNNDLFDARHYELFARLADVRGHHDDGDIAGGRGLPNYMSKEVSNDAARWGLDGHSYTWMTLEEAEQAAGVNDEFDAFVAWLKARQAPWESTRLVFWFDN